MLLPGGTTCLTTTQLSTVLPDSKYDVISQLSYKQHDHALATILPLITDIALMNNRPDAAIWHAD